MRGWQRTAAVLLVFLLPLASIAESPRSAYNRGKKAEVREDYEAAYEAYKLAYDQKPEELKYKIAYQRTRFLAASAKVHRGQQLRDTGRLEEALALFVRAVEIDPSSFIAQQEVRRTKAMMEGGATPGPPPSTPISDLARRAQDAAGPVELAPVSDQPITLSVTEDSKVLYTTIGKLAGINVLFDPDYTTPRRLKLDLNGVTLNEALGILALQSRTFWRPVTPNTIFVASDTSAKRKELEQNIVKTIYMTNVSGATEIQEMTNTIRTILELARITALPTQGAIVMRGTPDQVAVAEKLVGDIDRARPEVIVEVAIMQVRRDKLRQIGIQPPTSVSASISPTTTTTPSTTTTGGTTTTTTATNNLNLNTLAGLKATDIAITIPSASASLLFTDSNSRILQNPQIRAADNVKASLKIGDRVPVATGSFQPGIGGVGINPLVNTQFQYIDVGVNIDITPRIHANREVTLKLLIDVSQVTSRVSIGGIDQPVISQRKVEHEIRLKEGEVNLLGGIFEQDDADSWNGIPGLGQIPILKYFFAQDKKTRTESEIVFVLIPHIVRGPELTEMNLRAIDVGTGTGVDLRRRSPVRPATTPPSQGPAPTGAALQPAPVPATATTAAGTAATVGTVQAPPPSSLSPPATTPAQPAAAQPSADQATRPAQPSVVNLRFDPAAITQQSGATFPVNVVLTGGRDVYAIPIQVSYDAKTLQVVNVSNGDLLSRDGLAVALVHRDDPSTGTLQLTASRPPLARGIDGDGTVFTITFQAHDKGNSVLSVSRPGARDSSMMVIPATAAPATITIR